MDGSLINPIATFSKYNSGNATSSHRFSEYHKWLFAIRFFAFIPREYTVSYVYMYVCVRIQSSRDSLKLKGDEVEKF